MATGKQVYRVTVDGREFKRTSANEYTHIVVRNPGNEGDVVAWSGSQANAEKSAKQWRSWWPGVPFEVRAIEDVRWTERDGVLDIDIGLNP